MANSTAERQADEHGEQHEGERAAAVLLAGVDELLSAGGGGDQRERRHRRHDQHDEVTQAASHVGSPHVRAGTGAGPAASRRFARSASSRSRQCRPSSPSPNRIDRADQREDRREPQLAEVTLEDHEAVLVGGRVAHGLRTAGHRTAWSGGCTAHTSTTATSGLWVNWKSRNSGRCRRPRRCPPSGTRSPCSNLANLLSSGVGFSIAVGCTVTSRSSTCSLHVRRLDRVDLVLLGDLLGFGVPGLVEAGDVLLDLPFGDAALQACSAATGSSPTARSGPP